MFTQIRVISIPVKDQQVAKKFYTDILGCTVERDTAFSPDGKTRWISLALPGVETMITLVTWFPQMPPGSIQGLVLATDDIAKTYAELKTRGLALSEIDKQPYGQEATFNDPDGNGWVLQQPASAP